MSEANQAQLATQFQDFETSKAFLRKADPNGRTLYDHLTSVILEVVKQKPDNPLEAFEAISVRVKQGAIDPTVYKEVPAIPEQSEEYKRLSSSVNKTLELVSPQYDEDDEIPEPALVPDIVAEAQLLEWAGVRFKTDEIYKVYLSIQKCATDNNLEDVRFVGKIFGTKADYYIMEASSLNDDDDENDDIELPGSGANEYVYYASNNPEGPWTRLPQLRPEWVVIARQTRRFFTGDLNASVLGFPRFPGNEAAYLRTQIARIVASTVIAPKGYYTQRNGESKAVREPGAQILLPQDLVAAENWEHARPYIMKSGRTENAPQDEEEDQDQEQLEQPKERFLPISDDVDETGEIPLSETTNVWNISIQPNEADLYAASVASSMTWPGAFTVAKDKTVVSIYVGYGHRYRSTPYTPPPPPPVQLEFPMEAGSFLEESPDPQPPNQEAEEDDNEGLYAEEDEDYGDEEN